METQAVSTPLAEKAENYWMKLEAKLHGVSEPIFLRLYLRVEQPRQQSSDLWSCTAHAHKGKHIITTQIEHHAVLHPMEELEKEGFEVTFLPVDESGVVSVEAVEEALRPDTIFVSIMRVNNETGMQQPIEAIGERLKEHQAIFHTDAVQAYGLEKLDVTALNVDLLSVSSHKIYGPKGIGFLYRNDDIHLAQQIFGGEQERKWRSGTENMLGIVGFKKAIELLEKEREDRMTHYQRLSEKFIAGLN